MKVLVLATLLLLSVGAAGSSNAEEQRAAELSAANEFEDGQSVTVVVSNPDTAFEIGEQDKGVVDRSNIQNCGEEICQGIGICNAECGTVLGFQSCVNSNSWWCCFGDCS